MNSRGYFRFAILDIAVRSSLTFFLVLLKFYDEQNSICFHVLRNFRVDDKVCFSTEALQVILRSFVSTYAEH